MVTMKVDGVTYEVISIRKPEHGDVYLAGMLTVVRAWGTHMEDRPILRILDDLEQKKQP